MGKKRRVYKTIVDAKMMSRIKKMNKTMSTREIAGKIKISHTTVWRALNK